MSLQQILFPRVGSVGIVIQDVGTGEVAAARVSDAAPLIERPLHSAEYTHARVDLHVMDLGLQNKALRI